MKVKDLIELLLDCDKELDVIDSNYTDLCVVKEETVHSFKEDSKGTLNGGKQATKHLILEFSGE